MIPCHAHTQGASIGDAMLKVKPYVKKAVELNLPAISITNHGSMADMYEFYTECIANNIKPIIGCEVYECLDRNDRPKKKKTKKDLAEEEKLREQGIEPIDNSTFHLVLLAVNNKGVQNLLNICSDAEIVGKYYKPRTDLSVLKECGEGIIALTGCVGGRIPKLLLEESEYDALVFLEKLRDIFDDVYLETQPGYFDEQIQANKKLLELSKTANCELIVTNDIHYLNAEDYQAHDSHVKSNRKKDKDSEMIYPDKCYYLMSAEEIKSLMMKQNIFTEEEIDRMIANTYKIADMVDIELDTNIKMPHADVPEGYSAKTLIEKLCLQRLEEIKYQIKSPANYVTRIFYELDVIDELDFSDYFLMVRGLVMYAKNNRIAVGPGRGSVCGSLIAYLLRITEVDPIRYDLLFERFLSVHRKGSIPDIDLDFTSEKRPIMFDYTIKTYGEEYCAQVSTKSNRKARAAIRDAAKIYNIDLDIEDTVAKLIPQVYYEEDEKLTDLSVEQSLEIVPELKEYQKIYPEWIQTAIDMEDLTKASSIHPAGILISNTKLSDIVPLVKQDKKEINATALDLEQAELAGLVKMDYLGLSTLYVVDRVENETGFRFDREFGNYNDENVWNLISSRNLTGLFQISSKIYRDRMSKLAPKTIKELAACLALVRGPCISAKTDKLYMDIKAGNAEVQLVHPLYDEVVKETNGIMIYQEQLMKVCVNFGFTLEEGYQIMKASAKKKFDKLKSYEKKFMILASERNVDEETAEKIFKMIVDSGLYSFNESHAIAYAILCYVTAYYKYYFPTNFMAAELTNVYQNTGKGSDDILDTVKECRRLGIKFVEVDINESDWEFKVEDDLLIRVGLCSISSFGVKAAEQVLTHRPFVNIEDLIEKVEGKSCGKSALVPLMLSGAFGDRTGDYEYYMRLRGEEPLSNVRIHNHLHIEIYSEDYEIESLLLGSPYTTSPVNTFAKVNYDRYNKNAIIKTKGYITRVTAKKKNDKTMCFISIETGDGGIEILCFDDKYKEYKKLLKKDSILDFTIRKRNDESAILVQVK